MNKQKNLVTIIAIAFLFLAVADGWPYDFFILLRFVVCASTTFLAWRSHGIKKTSWTWLFALMAVLFNPLIPIYLSRDTWVVIDIMVGLALTASLFFFKMATDQRQVDSPSPILGYKRGVFVLVRKLPSGGDSYITFKPANEEAGPLQASFHLAIFNELQFANWYAVNMEKKLKENNTSDFPADGPFLIQEILDQAKWDFVLESVLADGLTTDAVLNPCEGNDTHRCPIVYVDFREYADFSKLKEDFFRCPNKHISIIDEKNKIGKKDLVMFPSPEKFLRVRVNE